MLRRLLPSLFAIGIFSGCGSDSSTDPVARTDAATLAYFRFEEKSGTGLVDETGRSSGILVGATRVEGIEGDGLLLASGKYAQFDSIVPNHTRSGTLELDIRVGENWSETGSYALFGNRGSRLNLFYQSGKLYYMKGHDNLFKTVGAEIEFLPGVWHHIAATWGKKGMRLLVDDELVASNQDTTDYQRPPAGFEVFHAGRKEWCCMENIGIQDRTTSYFFDGAIDELKISSVERY